MVRASGKTGEHEEAIACARRGEDSWAGPGGGTGVMPSWTWAARTSRCSPSSGGARAGSRTRPHGIQRGASLRGCNGAIGRRPGGVRAVSSTSTGTAWPDQPDPGAVGVGHAGVRGSVEPVLRQDALRAFDRKRRGRRPPGIPSPTIRMGTFFVASDQGGERPGRAPTDSCLAVNPPAPPGPGGNGPGPGYARKGGAVEAV